MSAISIERQWDVREQGLVRLSAIVDSVGLAVPSFCSFVLGLLVCDEILLETGCRERDAAQWPCARAACSLLVIKCMIKY